MMFYIHFGPEQLVAGLVLLFIIGLAWTFRK